MVELREQGVEPRPRNCRGTLPSHVHVDGNRRDCDDQAQRSGDQIVNRNESWRYEWAAGEGGQG
jgi:hypothetical protein